MSNMEIKAYYFFFVVRPPEQKKITAEYYEGIPYQIVFQTYHLNRV